MKEKEITRRTFLGLATASAALHLAPWTISCQRKTDYFIYNGQPLTLNATSFKDAISSFELNDLDDPQPVHKATLVDCTPLTERLWRNAVNDVESNIIEADGQKYLGAGSDFGPKIFTRDTSYSGVLGINFLYPEIVKSSLKVARKARKYLAWRVKSKEYLTPEIKVDWKVENTNFLAKYKTNSYVRRTDDVIWLWCAADLAEKSGKIEDYQWIYEDGNYFFEHFYFPFFDETDGLFRGQATYIDIHFENNWKATGYPQA